VSVKMTVPFQAFQAMKTTFISEADRPGIYRAVAVFVGGGLLAIPSAWGTVWLSAWALPSRSHHDSKQSFRLEPSVWKGSRSGLRTGGLGKRRSLLALDYWLYARSGQRHLHICTASKQQGPTACASAGRRSSQPCQSSSPPSLVDWH
jgi:hypothetical protein